MEEKYAKVNFEKDPVYQSLLWKSFDDHYDNPYLCYGKYLREQADLLKEGKMPLEVYNNFLEKGVSGVLQELKQRDKNSALLKKIKKENPELF